MIRREQLKSEIERLDGRYLELVFKIICQFPHAPEKQKLRQQGHKAALILQKIADSGGLGISDPLAWQREVRQERALPFRNY